MKAFLLPLFAFFVLAIPLSEAQQQDAPSSPVECQVTATPINHRGEPVTSEPVNFNYLVGVKEFYSVARTKTHKIYLHLIPGTGSSPGRHVLSMSFVDLRVRTMFEKHSSVPTHGKLTFSISGKDLIGFEGTDGMSSLPENPDNENIVVECFQKNQGPRKSKI